jgi:subtilisin family serine protease
VHFYDAQMSPVELELMPTALPPEVYVTATPQPSLGAMAEASPVLRAGRAFFDLDRQRGPVRARPTAPLLEGPPPAVFREKETGLIRTFRREIVLRFHDRVSVRRQKEILLAHGLEIRRSNPFVARQVIVADKDRKRFGTDLVDVANALAETDEIAFAAPNFVSEYRRHLVVKVPSAQWHLANKGVSPQKKGEDLNVVPAWKTTRGKGIVVAVVDDGVDLEHPALKARLWRNPDTAAPDRNGRDFFLPPEHPDHFNPRPKKWRYPYSEMAGNDSHGTPCAGLVAARSDGTVGVAPEARILAVKVFHADELAADEFVANAIRYAGRYADVISCSWSGGTNPDLQTAIADVAAEGRGGRGCVLLFAAGNEEANKIPFPASHPSVIAVGASTDQGERAWYSNRGKELAVVAPSNGGVKGVFTTDVSLKGRGFNVGEVALGGADGISTNDFGGTSAATPMVAGVAALVLAANKELSATAVRELLCSTASKVGTGYDPTGHSRDFGFGRVDASAAVAAAVSRKKNG